MYQTTERENERNYVVFASINIIQRDMDNNKYKLNSLSFAITYNCNLKCSFCSRDAGDGKNISLELMQNTIEDALKFADLKMINLTGGEPFLHPQFEEILKLISSRKLDIRINTNGLCLDDRGRELIDKYGVKLFTFSLDSSCKDIHDGLRGVDGSFERSVKNIKNLRDKGYKYFVKATVNEENVDTIYDLMKMSYEELGAYGFSISRTVPVGRACGQGYIQNDFIYKFMNLGRQCSIYAKEKHKQFLIDDPIRFKFDERVKNFVENYEAFCGDIRGGCTAGTSFLYILPEGDVLICPGLTLPVGNVKEQSLQAIWEESEIIKRVRSREELKGKCGKCIYKQLCGGCRAYAFATTGDYLESDFFCID